MDHGLPESDRLGCVYTGLGLALGVIKSWLATRLQGLGNREPVGYIQAKKIPNARKHHLIVEQIILSNFESEICLIK
jgi:hypothetical protein